MTKTIIKVDKNGKPAKELLFVQTRKIARQKMKAEQGNNKISKKWNQKQTDHGARFWA